MSDGPIGSIEPIEAAESPQVTPRGASETPQCVSPPPERAGTSNVGSRSTTPTSAGTPAKRAVNAISAEEMEKRVQAEIQRRVKEEMEKRMRQQEEARQKQRNAEDEEAARVLAKKAEAEREMKAINEQMAEAARKLQELHAETKRKEEEAAAAASQPEQSRGAFADGLTGKDLRRGPTGKYGSHADPAANASSATAHSRTSTPGSASHTNDDASVASTTPGSDYEDVSDAAESDHAESQNVSFSYASNVLDSHTLDDMEPMPAAVLQEFEGVAMTAPPPDRVRLRVEAFETPRESGVCVRPPSFEPSQPLPQTHLHLQLGVMSAKQTIVSLLPSQLAPTKGVVCDRDPQTEPPRTRISSATFDFEGILHNAPDEAEEPEDGAAESETGSGDDDDNDETTEGRGAVARARARAMKQQQRPWEVELVDVDAAVARLGPSEAVESISSCFSVPDPLQTWERARGKLFPPPSAAPAVPPGSPALSPAGSPAGAKRQPGLETALSGLSGARLWALEYEPRKPLRSMSLFTGGSLLEIHVSEIATSLSSHFGANTDPVFFSLALYVISASHNTKITETFYFSHDTDAFFPHKTPFETQRRRTMITFVPNEFKSAHLHLVLRAYRLASEEFDAEADLYVRPTSYATSHAVSLKQKVQQLAMYSDICEELGWFACSIVAKGELLQGEFIVDKLLRAPAPLSDAQLFECVLSEKKRSYCRPLPLNLVLKLRNVTDHEVSFPQHMSEPMPIEMEASITVQDQNQMGARPRTARYIPCAVPILNCGPFNAYVNVMYVRLNSLRLASLSSRGLPAKCKSFIVQVSLKDNDNSFVSEGLPTVYGRSMAESIVETSGWSSTRCGHRDLELADEFKIQLPLVLTDRHHLFFTIYGVSFSKGMFAERHTVVGYAMLPIFSAGALFVRDVAELAVLQASHAATLGSGYLVKATQLQPSAFVNNGAHIFTCSVSAKSSVYVTNVTAANLFNAMPKSLVDITAAGSIGESCGTMEATLAAAGRRDQQDQAHTACATIISTLALSEIVAFCPALISYLLATVCSPSTNVGFKARCAAFRTLVDLMTKVDQYETTRAQGRPRDAASQARRTIVRYLYHLMSNDLLFEGVDRFPVAQLVAEVWLSELQALTSPDTATPSSPTRRSAGGHHYPQRLGELSWFFLDLILRSAILQSAKASPPAQERRQKGAGTATVAAAVVPPRARCFDPSFYAVLRQLIVVLDERVGGVVGLQLVVRISIFLRSMCLVCDRGEMLAIVRQYFKTLAAQKNSHLFTAVRIFTDGDDVLTLMQPLPGRHPSAFLLDVIVDVLCPCLLQSQREGRVSAVTLLYSLCIRTANNSSVPAPFVVSLARGLFRFAAFVAANWGKYKLHADKDGNLGTYDKRQLLALVMWTFYHQSRHSLQQWIAAADRASLVGMLQVLQEAQITYRYARGKNKCEIKVPSDVAPQLDMWDARHSVVVNLIGCRVAALVLEGQFATLQSVKADKADPLVFPFFTFLEQLVSLHNATPALQAGALVLHHTIVRLLPEILSGKARMSPGVVLLSFRLMSSVATPVRRIATYSFYFVAAQLHRITGSLSKLKSLTASALISVAESQGRDQRAAERRIKEHLTQLVDAATSTSRSGSGALTPTLRALAEEFPLGDRYVSDGDGVSYDAGSTAVVPTVYVSVTPLMSISPTQREQHKAQRAVPFATDLHQLVCNMCGLFSAVLRLQVDPAMKFAEARSAAFREIYVTFLRQNTLREAIKWITRLQEFNAAEGNFAEAAMCGVVLCALAFRVTEIFFHLKGDSTKGARLPRSVLTHVFWHDYVRIVPELETAFAADELYCIVADLTVIPDEKLYTLDGQILTLKAAAENFAKAQYFELAVHAIRLTDLFLLAKGDFKSSALVHDALTQWCGAIASNALDRRSARYMLVEVRAERLSSRPKDGLFSMRRVFRASPGATVESFGLFAKELAAALVGPSGAVFLEGEQRPKLKKHEVRYIVGVHRLQLVCDDAVRDSDDVLDRRMFIRQLQRQYLLDGSGAADATAQPSRQRDVTQRRMVTVSYELERPFPSTTSAIDVASASEKMLSPEESVEALLRQKAKLLELMDKKGAQLLDAVHEALCDEDFPTPGQYLVAVAAKFAEHAAVQELLGRVLGAAKHRFDACEASIEGRDADKYAAVMRAIVNLEIAVDPQSLTSNSSTSAAAAAAGEGDGSLR